VFTLQVQFVTRMHNRHISANELLQGACQRALRVSEPVARFWAARCAQAHLRVWVTLSSQRDLEERMHPVNVADAYRHGLNASKTLPTPSATCLVRTTPRRSSMLPPVPGFAWRALHSNGIVIREAIGRRKTPGFRRAIATKQSRESERPTAPGLLRSARNDDRGCAEAPAPSAIRT
jgi:hypothetical protein